MIASMTTLCVCIFYIMWLHCFMYKIPSCSLNRPLNSVQYFPNFGVSSSSTEIITATDTYGNQDLITKGKRFNQFQCAIIISAIPDKYQHWQLLSYGWFGQLSAPIRQVIFTCTTAIHTIVMMFTMCTVWGEKDGTKFIQETASTTWEEFSSAVLCSLRHQVMGSVLVLDLG